MEELEFTSCAYQDAWSQGTEVGFDQQCYGMANPTIGSMKAYKNYGTVEKQSFFFFYMSPS